ncbi:uncharacterized protein ARMOST_07686 [Armillaria ostoyae]|uniref:Uncharacterized protein n=1 Tax=Armillaria ostoyae TaxID=47428 RepID=A0A284R6J2_ARMOS|nr:uncharacterized protein ARMOST_07686 [Armillaria ostoyae]
MATISARATIESFPPFSFNTTLDTTRFAFSPVLTVTSHYLVNEFAAKNSDIIFPGLRGPSTANHPEGALHQIFRENYHHEVCLCRRGQQGAG